MDPLQERINLMNRRAFLRNSTLGIGAMGLSSLLGGADKTGINPQTGGLNSLPHFAPKAKRVIWLMMAGAPCQMDMFDYKPKMNDWFDKDLPKEIINGQRLTTMTSGQKRFPIAPSKYKFERCGKSGAWVSELLPYHKKMVDDVTFIKSMYTEQINHDPAITYIQTGNMIPGKPCLGSWLSYGLGTMNKDLPSFVVMTPSWTGRKQAQALYNRLWASGFLPSEYQGVALRAKGDPVLYLSNPNGVNSKVRRRMLDGLAEMNQETYNKANDPEILARTKQYEMAFKMQTSVPELTDISKESKKTLEMYGPDVHKKGTYAASCLLARRMIERDVRFVQIFHRGWDQHFNVAGDLPNQCRDIDQPSWALIQDLKQRGLLEDTLVIWGGEFGRTIYCQGKLTRQNYGRDHHPRCFTMWAAGAGIKPGLIHGETDDFSYNITKDPVHIRDLNATILHLMGIDHHRLTYKFQGLDQRITGVEECHIVKDILS